MKGCVEIIVELLLISRRHRCGRRQADRRWTLVQKPVIGRSSDAAVTVVMEGSGLGRSEVRA